MKEKPMQENKEKPDPSKLRGAELLDWISQELESDDPASRERAGKILGDYPGKGATAVVEKALNDSSATVRANAILAAFSDVDPPVILFEKAFKDPSPLVRRNALMVLEDQQGSVAQGVLAKLLLNPDPSVRSAALELFQVEKENPRTLTLLLDLVKKGNGEQRQVVYEAIEKIYPLFTWWKDVDRGDDQSRLKPAFELLYSDHSFFKWMLKHPNVAERLKVVGVLSRYTGKGLVKLHGMALQDSVVEVRAGALISLRSVADHAPKFTTLGFDIEKIGRIALTEPEPLMRISAIGVLEGLLSDWDVFEVVGPMLEDADRTVRLRIIQFLADQPLKPDLRMKDKQEYLSLWQKALDDEDQEVRARLVELIESGVKNWGLLPAAFHHANPSIQKAAAGVLERRALVIEKELREEDVYVRIQAAKSLYQYLGDHAPRLWRIVFQDRKQVWEPAVSLLKKQDRWIKNGDYPNIYSEHFYWKDVFAIFKAGLSAKDVEIRAAFAENLKDYELMRAERLIKIAVSDESVVVRRAAIAGLSALVSLDFSEAWDYLIEKVEPIVRQVLVDSDEQVRVLAVKCFTYYYPRIMRSLALIEIGLLDSSEAVRSECKHFFKKWGGHYQLKVLLSVLRSPDAMVRKNAAIIMRGHCQSLCGLAPALEGPLVDYVVAASTDGSQTIQDALSEETFGQIIQFLDLIAPFNQDAEPSASEIALAFDPWARHLLRGGREKPKPKPPSRPESWEDIQRRKTLGR